MRKVKNYTISKESFKGMLKAGRLNPCLEISFRDKTGSRPHKLSAGYSDGIYVYREDGETFVLSHNPRLGYVCLEIFRDDRQTGGIFLEHEMMAKVLGRDDLAPFTMIRRLFNYLY